jgi:hypothetical protein
VHPSNEFQPPPSWAPPIAAGAALTFSLQLLFQLVQALPVPALQLAGCCCCLAGFLPYGAVPAWIAARRDPWLTAGQGFAVAFIAVGLGSIAWALLAAGMTAAVDQDALRQGFRDAQEGLPDEQRLSQEQVEAMVDFARRALPYVPALHAAVTTVLAGFVGMLTVGIARGRRPAPPGP